MQRLAGWLRGRQKLLDEELRLLPETGLTRQRMQEAVDVSILLKNKPLSCKLKVNHIKEITTEEGR